MALVTVRDRDIITKSFRMLTRGITPSQALDVINWDLYYNVFSSAYGDNRYLNPAPQWSPATDPRYGRLLQTPEGGFGSLYKKVYEDNVTLLTITPSVAQFSGLLSFITNMFSPTAAIIANKGRAPSLAFYMGQGVGSIAFWPMQLFSISAQFLGFLMDSPKHNFWTTKPAMGAFTMAATGSLNDMLVKLNFIDPILPRRDQEQTDPLYGLKPDWNNAAAVSGLSQLIPDSVNSDGTVDLMRFIMKGTRKHRVLISRLAAMDNDPNITNLDQKLTRAKQLVEEVTFSPAVIAGESSQSFIEKEMNSVGKYRGDEEGMHVEQDSAYTNKDAYNNITPTGTGETPGTVGAGTGGTSNPVTQPQQMGDPGTINGGTPPLNPNERQGRPQAPGLDPLEAPSQQQQQSYYEDNPADRSWAGNVFDLVNTAIAGGMDAITFRVDGGGGSVRDSFSNSTGQSALAEKFNGLVRSANDFRFDIQGGNTGIDLADDLINSFKESAMGALSGSVIGNIPLALANNAYIKVPDHWTESSCDLHKESYSLSFRCNYAHPYEQIVKIWIPWALLVNMVAGYSSGGSSYTTPFYHRVFSKGRTVIRNAICSQMDFEFGAGPVGWTRDRKPLNMKVNMTFKDLDPWVSLPIDRSTSILDLTNPASVVSRILTDDTGYNNWTTRLAGVDYLDTILRYARLNRQITQAALGMKTSFSEANIAAKISDSVIGDLLRITQKPITR